jgi:hypothetical protein
MPLSLDTTGLAVNNYIPSEVHQVTSLALSNYGCLFLNKGPMFGRNITVFYTAQGTTTAVKLIYGTDYDLIYQLPGFGNTVESQVFGAIQFFNTTLTGTVNVGYQALGGNWTFDFVQINNYLSTNQFDANSQYVALTSSTPLYLPNDPSAIWPINSIQSVTIAQAQLPSIALGVIYLPLNATAVNNVFSGNVAVSNFPTIQPITATNLPLPSNAAQEIGGNLDSIDTSTTAIMTATGTPADTAYTGTGSSSLVAALKGVYSAIKGVLNIRPLTAVSDTVSIQGGNSTPVVVSMSALPIPTGAALESGGNLASISTSNTAMNTATGTIADTAYAGSGNGSMVSLLKGIFSKFASLITTSAGTAQRVVLVDPVTGNGTLVTVFHNADNQTIANTNYGLLTGGVPQLINATGNLDRQRSVAGDGMAATGLAAEAMMAFNATTGLYDRARSINNRLATEPLSIPTVSRKITVPAVSAGSINTPLTATCTRISIFANGTNIRYNIANVATLATINSHYINQGERLDFNVPLNANIAVLSDNGVGGFLELTELT